MLIATAKKNAVKKDFLNCDWFKHWSQTTSRFRELKRTRCGYGFVLKKRLNANFANLNKL
jgi:hypothetical protein